MTTTTVVYAVASIILFSIVLALAVGRGIRLADERTPVSRADITRRASYPPPVPPSKPREWDVDWLPEWINAPEEIDETAAMNREFVSLIQSAWEWDEEDAL